MTAADTSDANSFETKTPPRADFVDMDTMPQFNEPQANGMRPNQKSTLAGRGGANRRSKPTRKEVQAYFAQRGYKPLTWDDLPKLWSFVAKEVGAFKAPFDKLIARAVVLQEGWTPRRDTEFELRANLMSESYKKI